MSRKVFRRRNAALCFALAATANTGFSFAPSIDSGGVTPEVSGPPELRVIVDTVPPRLELSAARGDSGEIKATWQAVDPLLNADSLKLEYQTAGGQWRPVAMDRPKSGGDRGTASGTLTWWPTDAPESNVSIRAEISDRAGNVAVSQAKASGNPAITAAAARPKVDKSIPAPLVESTTQTGLNPNFNQGSIAASRSGTPWPANQPTDAPLRQNLPSNDRSFSGAETYRSPLHRQPKRSAVRRHHSHADRRSVPLAARQAARIFRRGSLKWWEDGKRQSADSQSGHPRH